MIMSQPIEIGYRQSRDGNLVRLAWYPHGEIPIPSHGADVRTDGKLIRVATLVATHDPSLLTYPTPANDAWGHPAPAA